MKKLVLAPLLATIIFGAQIASAQVYYNTPVNYSYSSNCVSLSRDLSFGSRGSDVSSLQSFIVSRNYPGGGSWMITGYFGNATRAGVVNFQKDMNLPQTGYVDAATRAAISQVTCGYGYNQQINWNNYYNYNQYPFNYNYGYPYNNTTNTNCGTYYGSTCQCGWYSVGGYSYYNNCGNQNTGSISISYLSPNSGGVGTSVTVYGTGFSLTGNSVRFGNGIITNLISTDGRSVSFVVPSTLSGYGSSQVTLGTYNVSVTNASGAISNSVPFVVTSTIGGSGAPSITGISGPTNIGTNVQGTWTISFNNNQTNSYTTTSVNWGDSNVYGASLSPVQTTYAQGAQTQTFTHSYSQAGTYTITFTVTGVNGLSNTSSMTVYVSGSNTSAVNISYLAPTSGRTGTQVQIIGSGFSALDNTVRFGNGGTMHVPSQNGTVIYFTIPSYVSPCDVQPNTYCTLVAQQVTPGQYQISVSNSNNTSNALTFTVTQ